MAKGKIEFGIGFNVDKSGLNQITSVLKEIQNMSVRDLIDFNTRDIDSARKKLKDVQDAADAVTLALQKSYNAKLGTHNIEAFNKALNDSGYTLGSIKKEFDQVGKGAEVFNKVTKSLSTTNAELKKTEGFFDRMANTLFNTIRWSIASSSINKITGSIEKAYSFTKELDESLNDIRIVTGKSADDMAKFAIQANRAAKEIGGLTTDYTKAALIFYQQGLGGSDVQARANVTTKVANVTGQNTNTVSDQLTAIWNGYKVQASEAETAIDKVSAVAASTAADLAELSEGMGKVASAANSMGVDIDQLNASLSTIISVTRQDASAIGTSLKTIFSRVGDLAIGGEDEFGVKLGDVSGQLKQVGIEVLDASGDLRDMGTVIEEVGAKWDNWTKAQQQAVAIAIAGKRQYNNLIALFENWDMYESAKATSANAQGTLEEQNEIYLESTQAHLDKLTVSAERLYDSLFDSEGFKDFLNIVTIGVDKIGDFVDAIGGTSGTFNLLLTVFATIFNKKITTEVTNLIDKFNIWRQSSKSTAEIIKNISLLDLEEELDDVDKKILSIRENAKVLYNKGLISEDSFNQLNAMADTEEEMIKHREQYNNFVQKTDKLIGTSDWNAMGESSDNTAWEDFWNRLQDRQDQIEDYKGKLSELVEIQGQAISGRRDSANIQRKSFLSDELEKTKVNLGKAENNLEGISDKSTEEYIKQAAAVDSLKKKIETLQEQQASYTSSLTESNDKLKSNIKSYKQAYDSLLKDTAVSKSTKDALTKAAENAVKAGVNVFETSSTAISEQGEKAGKKFLLAIQKAVKEAEGKVSSIGKEAADKIRQQNEDKKAREELERKNREIQAEADRREAISSVTAAVGAMGALNTSMAITKQYLSDLTSGTISAGEGFSRLVTTVGGLGIGIGNFANSVKRSMAVTKNAFREGTAAAVKFNAALGIIGLVAEAITILIPLITMAVEALQKWNKKEAEAAKQASENAENLKEKYQEVKTAYDELIKSISAYDEAKKAINQLTIGTDEWKEKIKEANEEVRELLQKYPELAQFVNLNRTTGELSFQEKALENLEKQQKDAVNLTSIAMLSSNIVKANATYEAEIAEVRNSLPSYKVTRRGTNFDTLEYEEQTEYKNLSNEDIKQIVSLYQNNPLLFNDREKLKTILESIGLKSDRDKLVDILIDNKNSIDSLIKQLEITTESNRNLATAIGEQLYEGDERYEESKYRGAIAEIEGAAYREAFDKRMSEYEDKGHKVGGKWDSTIQDEYATMMEETGQWRNATPQNLWNNKGRYTFFNVKTGKNEEKTLSDEQVRNELAAYYARKDVKNKDNIDNINKIYASLERRFGKDIFSTGGFTAGQIGSFDALTNEEVLRVVSQRVSLTNDEAVALGYESAEKFTEAIAEAYNNYMATEAGIVFEEGIDKEQFKNLTLAAKRQYAELWNAIATDQAAPQKEAAQRILKNLGDNAEQVLESMGKVDWEDRNSIAKFQKELVGVLGESAESDIESFIDSIKRVEGVFGNYNPKKVQESNTAIASIISKINEIGDKITPTEFEQLDYEMKQYFVTLEDGTKALTISARQFKQELRALQIEKAKKAYEDAQAAETDLKNKVPTLTAEKNRRDAELRALRRFNFVVGPQNRNMNSEDVEEYADLVGQQMQYILENSDMFGHVNLEYWQTHMHRLDVRQGMRGAIQEIIAKREEEFANTENSWRIASETAAAGENQSESVKNAAQDYAAIARGDKAVLDQLLAVNAIDPEIYKKYIALAEAEKVKLEIDELAAIDDELQKINNAYESIENNLDSLYGEEYEKALKEQNSLLQQQIKLLKSRIDLLQNQAKNYRTGDNSANTELSKEIQRLLGSDIGLNLSDEDAVALKGLKLEFDEDGTIKNYEQIVQTLQKTIDQFTITENAEEEIAFFEDFIKKMDEYQEKVINDIPDAVNSFNDAIGTALQKNLDAFDKKLSNINKKYEIIKEYQDFVRELTIDEEDYYGLINSYITEFQNGLNKTVDIQKELNDLDKLKVVSEERYAELVAKGAQDLDQYITEQGKINKQQEIQKLLQEQILSNKELLSKFDELQINQLNKVNEGYEKQIEYLENINSLINNQIKMTELLDGKNKTALNALYDRQVAQAQRITSTRQNAYDDARANYETLLGSGASEDVLEAARQAMLQAGQALSDSIIAQAEIIKEQYGRAIEARFAQLFGTSDFESIEKQQEWIDKEADSHYDVVEKAYALREMENKFNQAINSTNDVKAQRDLLELKEKELGVLEDEDKLTEKDVARAQAKLDILQAEIALRDAQQAKTQMQLTRNADGSYSYQYVADSANILEKEQALAEAQKSLYSIDKEQYKNNLNDILEMTTSFFEELKKALIDDGYIDGAEKLVLGKAYEMIQEMVSRHLPFMENLIESIRGTEGFEDLDEEELKKLFPEYSADFLRIVSAIDQGLSFEKFLENFSSEDMQAIWSDLENLGKKADEVNKEVGGSEEEALIDAETDTEAYQKQAEAVVLLTDKIKTLSESYQKLADDILEVITALNVSLLVDQGLADNSRGYAKSLLVPSQAVAKEIEQEHGNVAGSGNSLISSTVQSGINIMPAPVIGSMPIKAEIIMPNVVSGADAQLIVDALTSLPQLATQNAFKNNIASNGWQFSV